MRSDARDRAETRDYYCTHALAERGVVRDIISAMDELDEAWAEVDRLRTVAHAAQSLLDDADTLGVLHLCRSIEYQCPAVTTLRCEGRQIGSVSTSGAALREALSAWEAKP